MRKINDNTNNNNNINNPKIKEKELVIPQNLRNIVDVAMGNMNEHNTKQRKIEKHR